MIKGSNSAFANSLRRIKHGGRRRVRNAILGMSEFVVARRTARKVVTGPFAQMRFSLEHVFGAPFAKLLGVYEMELHPLLNKLLKQRWLKFVDVGAAEGYYAVGVAIRGHVDEVIAYELTEKGRRIILENARLNNVESKIEIRGECFEQDLLADMTGDSGLLLMDIEGAELRMLTPTVIDAGRHWTILVEAHDHLGFPGCTDQIVQRLQQTHDVETFSTTDRKLADFPLDNSFLPRWVKHSLMNEGRGNVMHWVLGSPKASRKR